MRRAAIVIALAIAVVGLLGAGRPRSRVITAPTQIPGCVMWLRADLGVTKDGDNLVSAWEDQVGAVVFTQADPSKQPLWVADGGPVVGAPGILFDDTIPEVLLYPDILTSATEGTVVATICPTTEEVNSVCKCYFASCDEATSNYCMIFSVSAVAIGGPNYNQVYHKAGKISIVRAATTNLVLGQYRVVATSSDAAAYTMRVGSMSPEALEIRNGSNNGKWFGDTPNRDSCTVGAARYGGLDRGYGGYIYEIALYNRPLTTAELRSLL
jgi:hypothetical protein